MTRQIILIPGTMGTVLLSNGSRVWPRYVRHRFDVNAYARLLANHQVTPSKLIGIYYNRIAAHLRTFPETIVDEFPYDWRLNNLSHLERLRAKIRTDVDEIVIIAHSMGGLIAKLLLAQYEDEEWVGNVTKLITLGTPWLGSPKAYKALKYGFGLPSDKIEWTLTREMSKKMSAEFESTYQLLPTRFYNQEALVHEKYVFIEYDGRYLFDWDDVVDRFYRPFLDQYHHEYDSVFSDFERLLSRKLSVEHHEIIGVGQETICTVRENTMGEPEGVFGNGDGTVPVISAMSDTPHKYFVYAAHEDLPRDELVLNMLGSIVIGIEPPGRLENVYHTYEEIRHTGFSGRAIRISCPVLVSLTDTQGNMIYGNIEALTETDLHYLIDSDVHVINLGTTTYLLIDDVDGDNGTNAARGETVEGHLGQRVIIEAYDSGTTSVSIQRYEHGRIAVTTAFGSFQVDSDTAAELFLGHGNEAEYHIDITRGGESVGRLEPITAEVLADLDITYPSSHVVLLGERLGERGAFQLMTGDVSLELAAVETGTYPIVETLVVVDGGISTLFSDDGAVSLTLTEGEHTITSFSKDVMGNVGNITEFRIAYIADVFPKIFVKFYPHEYTLEAKFGEEVHEATGILLPRVSYNYNINDGASGNTVRYRGVGRRIDVSLQSIVGREKRVSLFVDEHAVMSLFDGTGNEGNMREIMRGLGIDRSFTSKLIRYDGRRALRSLTSENLRKSKRVIIDSDGVEIEIIKHSQYLVSFQNLSEDLRLSERDVYDLRFKVIDSTLQREVKSLRLTCFMKVEVGLDELFTQDSVIEFSDEHEAYQARLRLSEVRTLLSGYWQANDLYRDLYRLVIVIRDDGSTLREQPITIWR